MAEGTYRYIIVGGGLAGSSAADGIREMDKSGPILLIGDEAQRPYDRPPLSKKLWFGQKKVEDIFLHDWNYYDGNGIELKLGTKVVSVDPSLKKVTDSEGYNYRYEKLLLATGGSPHRLSIAGGDLSEIYYYRYLDDYLKMRQQASEGKRVLVVGGGFIGSEIAAALNINKLKVTMLFPDKYLVKRIFPEALGVAIRRHYEQSDVAMMTGDQPVSFERRGGEIVTRTKNDKELISDIVIAGIGISPEIKLAEAAGLSTGNGVVVNEYLQSSNPAIYAAGDNAMFPYKALGRQARIEHWDNSLTQGRLAGRNMAGAGEAYTHMPYFFSDLFKFGYEAVGEIDSELETFADWQKENDTGVIYYMKDGKVRGAMMCNVWDKVDAARALIQKGEKVSAESLRGAIR